MRLAAALLLGLVGGPAAALEIGLPLACEPGVDCWIVRYVDHDPAPGFADHRCGRLGSDGHDGTDFALRDMPAMEAGVNVRAAAGGRVRAVRDGMPDQPPDGTLRHDFGRQNCGNGVLLDHGAGWQTQYCHLRQGSVAVRAGEEVAAGQALGLVGMSGEANLPHLHLSVRRDGRKIDPFTGTGMEEACDVADTPLWQADLRPRLAYVAVPIAVVGLTDHPPEHREIVAGSVGSEALTSKSPALVAYLLAYGILARDRIELAILGPDGDEIARADVTAAEDAPRASRSVGRRRPDEGWRPGRYRVEAEVHRAGRSWRRVQEFVVS